MLHVNKGNPCFPCFFFVQKQRFFIKQGFFKTRVFWRPSGRQRKIRRPQAAAKKKQGFSAAEGRREEKKTRVFGGRRPPRRKKNKSFPAAEGRPEKRKQEFSPLESYRISQQCQKLFNPCFPENMFFQLWKPLFFFSCLWLSKTLVFFNCLWVSKTLVFFSNQALAISLLRARRKTFVYFNCQLCFFQLSENHCFFFR